MKTYTEQFKTARARGVPLVLMTSADPSATINATLKALNGKLEEVPVLIWDCVRGLNGHADSKLGKAIAAELNENGNPALITANAVECLIRLNTAPENCLTFMLGSSAILQNEIVIQAIWNLRDIFKSNGNTLVLLALQGTKPPAALKDDIITIAASLPTPEELEAITGSILQDAGLPKADKATTGRAIDATLGLSAFGAEQTLAMSLTKEGIDSAELWEKKRIMIEQTPGLECYRGEESFDSIRGLENVKEFFSNLIKGKDRPRVFVLIDEIEKALAGIKGDTSGTAQGTHGEILKTMADYKIPGTFFIGVPGAAKTVTARAIANAAQVPLIQLDLKGMESSLVGSSLQNLKAGLETIKAIGQGKVYFIATCNSFGELSPELKRRFKRGTFFFDLPTADERAAIWELYCKKYNRKAKETLPENEGWTGAEIQSCVEIADSLNISLIAAAAYIVPMAKSAADTIKNLRTQANGKFISASYAGTYQYNEQAAAAAPQGRKFKAE